MSSTPTPDSTATPYERLGGEAGLREILDDFYDRLFADPMVGFLFSGRDKEHLVARQLQFVSRALGGPQEYEGQAIRAAHAALPILVGHFHRRHQILKETLEDHRADPEASKAWLDLDLRLRPSVVRPKPKA